MNIPDVYRKAGSKNYYFNWTSPVTGRRYFKSTGKKTKPEARAVVFQFVKDHIEGVDERPLREYAEPFFLEGLCPRAARLRAEGKNYGTLHMKRSREWLENYVLPDRIADVSMKDLRRRHVLDFRARLLQIYPDRINTINKAVGVLKTIISEAFYREDIPGNPGALVGNIVKKSTEKGILTPSEIHELFTCPGIWEDRRAHACFMTAAYCGMRMGEVLGLHWRQVDLAAEIITIDTAWKTQDELGLPKWDKIRVIPIASSLAEELKEYRERSNTLKEDQDLVFCWEDGVRMGPTWWRKTFQEALVNAGIYQKTVRSTRKGLRKDGSEKIYTYYDYKSADGRNITPHSLRHGLNTHLLDVGIDPLKVQMYLGWSNRLTPILTKVQAGYTHIEPKHLLMVGQIIQNIYSTTSV